MSSLHRFTPSLAAFDSRGATVRAVAYHRQRTEDEPVARISRNTFGATGFLQQQWDPRLYALQAVNAGVRANFSHRHSLSGRELRTDSVDAGWRIALTGSAGQPVRLWDSRGSHRHEYDAMLRPVAVFEQATDEPLERCVERLSHGLKTAEHAAHNRCGRLIRHDDPAGSLSVDGYGLWGAVTGQTRSLMEIDAQVDWPVPGHLPGPELAPEHFVSTWQYDALGGMRAMTDARGNRRLWQYDVDGELARVDLVFSSGRRKVVLDRRVYNAMGQVTSERGGNGMVTVASYDDAVGNLLRLATRRSQLQGSPLQDLNYDYDRVGNVRSIQDAAQPTAWSGNARIDATRAFEYDSLYQLIKATGRENARHSSGAGLPGMVLFGATQDDLWRNYTRHYQYDAGGNLLLMQHVPSSGQGYTRRMTVAAHSNHGVLEGHGGGFDHAGNQQALAPGQVMSWNLRNQLMQVTRVVREDGDPDDETYLYDAGGQRVLKRSTSRTRTRTLLREVLYLPGLELRRDDATGRWLNVLSVQTGLMTVNALQWEQGRPAGVDNEQLRFSLADQSGSCTLELDEQAALLGQESYYPYGATAWWAAKSAIEASFRTIRHSGKERDATGLYYYGYRYYAPWLQRWINPDPAGAVDGLNLYAMVNNNPMTRVDHDGQASSTMAQRVSMGLQAVAFFTLVGLGLGFLLDAPAIGATGGALLGLVALAAVVLEGYGNARRRALHTPPEISAEDVAQWLSRQAIEIAETRGLSHEETNRLVNFFYEHQENQLLSVAAHTTKEGKIYGFVGPQQSTHMANKLMTTGLPLGKEMRQLGYKNILLRDPVRAQIGEPSTDAGASRFDAQAITGLAKRKVGKAVVPAARQERHVGAVQETSEPFNADIGAVDHLMAGREGRIIALTLAHLSEGRMAAVHWHRYRDEGGLWSADLHGYPGGGTGRGAMRLMLRHLGGSHYRVVGVRNPH